MSDRRLWPANARVAAAELAGLVEGVDLSDGTQARVTAPLTDLRAAPGGARDRQLLMGWPVRVLERRDGWAFMQSGRDGYVGYVPAQDVGDWSAPTHTIGVRASHLYPAPEVKAEAGAAMSFGAAVTIVDERRTFMETDTGHFIPKAHLRLIDRPFSDPATVAQLFFGAPYLWGGNSAAGIDCSGLVQAAMLACGRSCPGDSDLQSMAGIDVADLESLQRGDLVFWAGHVAMMVEPGVLIHANAHHMAVAYEPLDKAIARIDAQGGGAVTALRRIG